MVHTHGVVTLAFQYADDAEGNGVEADDLANGVAAVGKEIVHHSLAHHAHLGTGLDVVIIKHLAVGHLQFTDGEVVGIDAVDG